MKRAALLLALVFFKSVSYSQLLKGKIIDADSKQPVSFAVIALDNSNKGTTADLDGNFSITLAGSEKEIKIQVIGYISKTIAISELDLNSVNVIKLKASNIKLLEVVVTPGENPAIPIIKQVIARKPKHNINNLPYYLCNTYAKTYFTLSDNEGDENFYNKDSVTFARTKKILDKHYLFFMESVTEKKYVYKNHVQEKVLSSRVSGFKSAPFGAFASQLQSFTFYSDNIELMGLKYVSPLISGTFKRYNYEIADTVLSSGDTTILIKFFPKKNSTFNGMKGVLYINKNGYVLTNVLAEPAEIKKDGTGVKVQQLYEKIDSVTWFPRQANTEILFYGISTGPDDNAGKKKTIMKGVSRLYVKDVKLDSVIKIKNKSLVTLNEEDFDKKDETFWNKYRTDSLNKKELRTYGLIDSVGKEAKLDQKLKWFTALTTGKWQIGYFNIDLKHLLRVNEYEGFRVGMGLSTSNKLSRWFSIGGYGAYGFKDKAFKYGAQAQVNLNYRQSTFLLAEAANDVIETAGTFFLNENKAFLTTENLRNLLIAKMDKTGYAKMSLNATVLNVIKTSLYSKMEERISPSGFYNNLNSEQVSEQKKFVINETGIQLKYWPGEKFGESMGQLISLGSKKPVFFLNVAKGLKNTIQDYTSQLDYMRIDLRIDHQLNFKIKGYVSYQLQAGKVFGDVPYFLQYNNKGSLTDNYYISAEKTFETMYLNEFISTQYAAFFFAINSGKVFKTNKFCNPEFELVHNYGIGTLDNRERLTNIELNDLSKGYSEAGLRIRNIYKSGISSFGAGFFYRYGNYAFEAPEKNLAVKLVLGFVF